MKSLNVSFQVFLIISSTVKPTGKKLNHFKMFKGFFDWFNSCFLGNDCVSLTLPLRLGAFLRGNIWQSYLTSAIQQVCGTNLAEI
jgi:hypothetical protein